VLNTILALGILLCSSSVSKYVDVSVATETTSVELLFFRQFFVVISVSFFNLNGGLASLHVASKCFAIHLVFYLFLVSLFINYIQYFPFLCSC